MRKITQIVTGTITLIKQTSTVTIPIDKVEEVEIVTGNALDEIRVRTLVSTHIINYSKDKAKDLNLDIDKFQKYLDRYYFKKEE